MTDIANSTLLFDKRVECYSLMTVIPAIDYLTLVEDAYKKRGGLTHQREALKTTTAKRIRLRMVSDIKRGAILPPVVIGVVVESDVMHKIENQSPEDTVKMIRQDFVPSISIIDGMQRTTALLEAVESGKVSSAGSISEIRIEFWIAKSTDSLIYRMLVLNTGQVPWNLRRQLLVVFSPLVNEMQKYIRFERILDIDRPERRTKAGEYTPDSLVETYIAFGLRKTEIDTQEALAEEFSRLDMTDALAGNQYARYFYPVVQKMVDLDIAFSKYDAEIEAPDEGENTSEAIPAGSQRILSKGRNIFDSQPARVAFVVACAVAILGRIGMTRDEHVSDKKLSDMQSQVQNFIENLARMNRQSHEDFLKLDVLSERLFSQKRSAVGRQERAFFEAAFGVLVAENFEVPSMEPCWRA